jgi:hypothetical protein
LSDAWAAWLMPDSVIAIAAAKATPMREIVRVMVVSFYV